MRGSPKIWPIEAGVSRGSRRRKRSNDGSTWRATGSASVLTVDATRPASRRTVAVAGFPRVCTTTGTSSSSGAPGWVCSITKATSKPPPVDSRRSLSFACSRAAPGFSTWSAKKRPRSCPAAASSDFRTSANEACFPRYSR